MHSVDLASGPVEYHESGRTGPTLVFLPGVFVGATVWRHVIADLRADHRCIAVEMPLGAHRVPMNADADLSSRGLLEETLIVLTSEFGRRIFPCKGCVSTAMPLCHWPCSCYPNPALGQTGDWMNELYPRWVAAHGVVVVTPVHWYMVTSPLKLMMDRLVCADGGNPDVSSTHGKKAAEAKDLELAGWDYPQHLAGRVYGMVVHGDVAGIEGSRRALSDWMDWMGLVDAGATARIDRFIGYYGPYATSHEALDRDLGLQAEARNVGRAVAHAVRELRAGRLRQVQPDLERPRMK